MDNSYERPRLGRPFRQRLRTCLSFLFGVLVLALCVCVLAWLFGREEELAFRGIVDAGAENVGPVENARIVSVEVVPGQQVKAGDVLVRFDPASRLVEESMNEVKLREYEQTLARRREDLAGEERRCRQLVREATVALEERRMERLREQAELAALDAEIARLRPLVEKKLVSELELTALRPKADALRTTSAAFAPLLAALSNRLAQAEADLVDVARRIKDLSSDVPGSVDAALRDAMKRCEEARRADPSTLRALTDGIVSQVFRRAGDIVPAGEPVVRLAAGKGLRMVTGMLPADRLDDVHPGDELVVSRAVLPTRGAPGVVVTGRVETIDPEVLDFFDPMNTAPRVPVRGRKVRIRLMGDAEAFIPGEAVQIRSAAVPGFADALARLFSTGKGGDS